MSDSDSQNEFCRQPGPASCLAHLRGLLLAAAGCLLESGDGRTTPSQAPVLALFGALPLQARICGVAPVQVYSCRHPELRPRAPPEAPRSGAGRVVARVSPAF
jgi:hypothetical protein